MDCPRCAHDVARETSDPSAPEYESGVAVQALVCPECGGPLGDGGTQARLDRFGLAGRSRPLLEARPEVA